MSLKVVVVCACYVCEVTFCALLCFLLCLNSNAAAVFIQSKTSLFPLALFSPASRKSHLSLPTPHTRARTFNIIALLWFFTPPPTNIFQPCRRRNFFYYYFRCSFQLLLLLFSVLSLYFHFVFAFSALSSFYPQLFTLSPSVAVVSQKSFQARVSVCKRRHPPPKPTILLLLLLLQTICSDRA